MINKTTKVLCLKKIKITDNKVQTTSEKCQFEKEKKKKKILAAEKK